jgi:hypothetical protein
VGNERNERSEGKNENVDRRPGSNEFAIWTTRVYVRDSVRRKGLGAQLSGPCGPRLCAGPGLFKEPK